MKSKSHVELRTRIQKVLWMILVLLCIGLIWRGLGAWLAIVESGYVPGNPVDISNLVPTITAYLLENWQSEFVQFVGPVIGLACLLHIGPFQAESIKWSRPSNARSSASTSDGMAGSAEIIS